MEQGWAYHSWLMENDGWLQFAGVRMSSVGYIRQETERLMNIAKKAYGWK